MRTSEIMTLADREIQRLTEENDHCAAIIMRALCDALRDALRTQRGAMENRDDPDPARGA